MNHTPKKPGDIAHEAANVVDERMADYGHPSENHACTAHMWNAYLRRRFEGTGFRLDARDVCLLNVLQKISRDAHTRKRDNLVDVIGFAINADMVDGES